MDNPKITNYDTGSILLGNNEFETGTLTVAANSTVKTGALLARDSNGKFVPVTATSGTGAQTPVALYVEGDVKNDDNANPVDVAIRAMISGRVKASVCNVAGADATAAELDMIRSYGIIPIKVTETTQEDNQ